MRSLDPLYPLDPAEEAEPGPRSGGAGWNFEPGYLPYWYALWSVGALAVLGVPVELALGYRAVGFLFLCGILALGLFYSFGPILFAAALSGAIWDYFFIPPRFTLSIGSPEDLMLIVALVFAALITGVLTRQIRRDRHHLKERERSQQLLLQLSAVFSGRDQAKALALAELQLNQTFGQEVAVFLADGQGGLDLEPPAAKPIRLWGAAAEAARRAQRFRRTTSTGLDAEAGPAFLFLPLLGYHEAHGVLACRLKDPAGPVGKERQLLESAARRLGLALERQALERKSREADRLRESEKLHQALLNSISHELRTPLTALLGSAAALRDEATARDPQRRQSLLDEVSGAGERLNRVIENLLDMARLSSGVLALKKEWQDPAELARLTAGRLRGPLGKHTLKLELPEGLPLIEVDYRLIEHALSNLLLNAAAYAPAGSAITLGARVAGASLEFSVADQGPGIPPESLPRLFQRFYRVPGSPAGGTGLGLFITQSLMQAHGGDARALNRPGGGAEFILSLPLQAQPAGPTEAP